MSQEKNLQSRKRACTLPSYEFRAESKLTISTASVSDAPPFGFQIHPSVRTSTNHHQHRGTITQAA